MNLYYPNTVHSHTYIGYTVTTMYQFLHSAEVLLKTSIHHALCVYHMCQWFKNKVVLMFMLKTSYTEWATVLEQSLLAHKKALLVYITWSAGVKTRLNCIICRTNVMQVGMYKTETQYIWTIKYIIYIYIKSLFLWSLAVSKCNRNRCHKLNKLQLIFFRDCSDCVHTPVIKYLEQHIH